MSEKTVSVPNISCGHCTRTIERELSELEGVQSVQADEDTRMVEIRWDDGKTSWAEIAALLREIQFPPEG
jgi:copper chaperone CopZ